jgi:hypothetical protein
MTNPSTATDVAANLARIARQLDQAVTDLRTLDEEAVRARSRFEVTFAKSFLQHEGALDVRKQQAIIETEKEKEKFDAEIADQRVRSQRALIDSLKVRIDVGRSYGTALRSEIALAGSGIAP